MEECENEAENAKPIFFRRCCCFGSLCLSALFNGTLELSIFYCCSLFVVVDFFGHSLYAYDRAMRRDMCVCGWRDDGMGLFQWLTERNLFDRHEEKSNSSNNNKRNSTLVYSSVGWLIFVCFVPSAPPPSTPFDSFVIPHI